MFEMMSLRTDAGLKSLSPLVDCLINDNLTEVWQDLRDAVSTHRHHVYALLIHSDSTKLCSRDDCEWPFTFPFPPIPTLSIPIPSDSHSQTVVQWSRCGINIFGVSNSKTRLTYNITVLSLSLNLAVYIKWSRIVIKGRILSYLHSSYPIVRYYYIS